MPMTAFLLQLSTWLPPTMPAPSRLRGADPPAGPVRHVRHGRTGRFRQIDTATVYALRHSVWPLCGGHRRVFQRRRPAPGFATGSWTFRHIWPEPSAWHVINGGRFLAANLGGFVINRGVYALLVTFVTAAARQPVIAVFAGAVAGMTLNFNLSRKMVFR